MRTKRDFLVVFAVAVGISARTDDIVNAATGNFACIIDGNDDTAGGNNSSVVVDGNDEIVSGDN